MNTFSQVVGQFHATTRDGSQRLVPTEARLFLIFSLRLLTRCSALSHSVRPCLNPLIIFGFGYDKDGFNKHGFDREGYDRSGFNADGWDRDGYDRNGYDRDGYDRDGYDRKGYDKDGYDKNGYGRDGYNKRGYDKKGFGKDGYNAAGYDKRGFNRQGFDSEGYDKKGFNKKGFDRDGYDKNGLDSQGYDRDGYNTDGWDRDGYDRDGYDRDGYDWNGFDRNGFDKEGYDEAGFDAEGYRKSGLDRFGYDREGFDYYGFNKDGFDRNGFDRNGYDSEGFDKAGFNKEGFGRDGFDKDGLDKEGYDKDGFDKCGFDKNGFNKDGFNARGFGADGLHRNGTQYDENGFNSAGLNELGLDEDGFNCDGLKPLEIKDKGQLIHETADEEINPIVRRAYLMCEDGDFLKANELVEKALNSNPEDGNAYLAALMVEKHVTSEDQLSYVSAFDFEDITESANYSKAVRFGSEKVKARLGAYAQKNKALVDDWVVLERDESRGRILIMSRYAMSRDYNISNERETSLITDDVASIPGNYITWEDSVIRKWMNSTYLDSAPLFIKVRIIESEVYTAGTERYWHYYPSNWQVPACTTWDKVFALSVDEVEKYFWNERDRIARYKDDNFASTWGLRSPGFYRVTMFHGLGWNNMTDSNAVVCYGNFSVSDGMWCSAYGRTAGSYGVDRYADGIGYRPAMWIDGNVTPSEAKAHNWFPEFEISYIEDIRAGATRNISFGGYLWRVLATTDDAALLITECVVRGATYTGKSLDSIQRSPSINWETSPVRKWLNGDFIDEMDESSAQRILSKKNMTHDNAFIKNATSFDDSYLLRHTDYMPQVTIDKVFCLDPFEASKYFSDADDRICLQTGDPTAWHLRSYSKDVDRFAFKVSEQGHVDWRGYDAADNRGIRPAVWIKLP